jgi:hypothetical protein
MTNHQRGATLWGWLEVVPALIGGLIGLAIGAWIGWQAILDWAKIDHISFAQMAVPTCVMTACVLAGLALYARRATP